MGARPLATKKRVLVMCRDRSKDVELPAWYAEILDGLVQRGLIIHQRHQALQHRDETAISQPKVTSNQDVLKSPPD